MSHFAIRKPVWNGGKRTVGLADARIQNLNTIEILYENKNGERLYPNTYKMTGEQLKKYPLTSFNPRVPLLRVVPIEDLVEA